jgi:hypothetical protein
MVPRPKAKARKASTKGKLSERAFGKAADGFGKEIAPLGKQAGAITVQVGRLLIRTVRDVVYGIEGVSSWLRDAVSKRLTHLTPDKLQKPNARIAVPAVQALLYSHEEEIREMFANLLAADMDPDKKSCAHVCFVEIIKQMSPLEAVIMSNWRQHHFYVDGVVEYEKRENPGDWYYLPTKRKPWVYEGELWLFLAGQIWSVFQAAKKLRELGSELRLKGSEKHDPSSWEIQAALSNQERLGLIQIAHEFGSEERSQARIAMHLTPLGKDFLEVCVTEASITPKEA